MNTKFRFALTLTGAAALLASAQLALSADGDWAQWQGPNRDGVSTETGLLKEWPADGPKLVWKAKGLGSGYSGVSMAGDRIFTAGDKGKENFVLALSRKDGSVLWTANLGKAGAPGWGGFGGPRATPSVDGSLVFAIGQYGDVVCVQAADGKEVWRKHLTTDFGGPLPEWGFAESPLVDGDRVILTPGGSKGTMIALNKKTGEVIWQTKDWTDAAHYSSSILVEIDGVKQYIQLTAASIAGVAVKDGAILWKAERKGSTAVVPTPIYSDHQVYVTSGYGTGCNLFKITSANGKFSAEQVYANKTVVNHHGGVVKVGDFIYGHSDSKGWVCQNFKTGESAWTEKDRLRKGSVIAADGMLICREEEGDHVALIEATSTGFKEKSRFKQPERAKEKSWPHPVVADGKLYLRDQDQLFCYDIKAK